MFFLDLARWPPNSLSHLPEHFSGRDQFLEGTGYPNELIGSSTNITSLDIRQSTTCHASAGGDHASRDSMTEPSHFEIRCGYHKNNSACYQIWNGRPSRLCFVLKIPKSMQRLDKGSIASGARLFASAADHVL
jgi:hypothetical protein